MPDNKAAQGGKIRKLPERQCVGCGGHFPKNSLVRIVRSPENTVSMDLTGKKSGRGAYICRNVKCLRKAKASHRADVKLCCTIPDEVYDVLEKELTEDA